MNNFRKLLLVLLAMMFVFPSVIQMGSVSNTTNIELTKNYTESYVHHDPIWIQNNEEFIAQADIEEWDGDGSEGDPFVITGYLFDCETQPLRIWHTTVYWIFTDNVIDGVGTGVQCGTWIENVTHGAIVNNEVYNRHSALAISGVEHFIVTGNYIHDCWGTGIEFFAAGMNNTIVQNNIIENIGVTGIYSTSSCDSVVKDNIISNCDNIGIALLGVTPNCNVTGNIISNVGSTGIMISFPENGYITGNTISYAIYQGIFMNGLSDCIVSGNTIGDVSGDGLRTANAEFSEIFENIIENCTGDGLLLYSGTNTSVHLNSVYNVTGYALNLETATTYFTVKYNTFIDNGVDCQVCDDGTSNLVSQNYYEDWNSPDADENGYVDSPYVLDGDAENQDDLPLALEGVGPDIVNSTKSTTTTTITTTTTDTTAADNPLPMEMILVAGAVVALVLVASVFLVKRR